MDCETSAAAAAVPGSRDDEIGRRLRVVAAMRSHAGCIRAVNEDCVLFSVPDDGSPDAEHGVLALVADGMGGHAAGEVASQIAAKSVHYLFYRQAQSVPAALSEAFAAANLAIHNRAQSDPTCAGMGTTCTAVVVRDNHIWLGHVGDSRAYLIRNGKIYRISEDHSLVAELVRQGTITESEAKDFPDRNVILRALGIEPVVNPMMWREGLPAKPGDVLVLCSDGLSDIVDDDTIRAKASSLAPADACEALIRSALDAQAPDNVSVGVLAVIGTEDRLKRVGRATRQIETAAKRKGAK